MFYKPKSYPTKPQAFFASHVLQIFSIIWPLKIDEGYNTSMILKKVISLILIKVVPLTPAQSVLKIKAQMIYFWISVEITVL